MLEKSPIKPNYLDFDNLETINKNAEKLYGYHRIFFDLPIIKKASNGNISENLKIFLDRLTNSANQYIHDSEAKRLKQLEEKKEKEIAEEKEKAIKEENEILSSLDSL